MKKLTLLVFTLIIICCSISCEYDFDVKIPFKRKLVALSNFSPDELIKVSISTNDIVSDSTDRSYYPRNAQVRLFEDGVFMENLAFVDEYSSQIYYQSKFRPEEGKKYSIQAFVSDFDTIYASDIIPPKINISQLEITDFASRTITDFEVINIYMLDVAVEIEADNIDEKYFHLNVWRNITQFHVDGYDTSFFKLPNYVDFTLNNLSHEDLTHDVGILIKGSDIKDNQNRFIIQTSFDLLPAYEIKTPIYFELRNVTEDYYKFHKSMSVQNVLSFERNYISSQAVRVHNNIQNGIGNFSAYHSCTDSVRWAK